MKYIPKQTDLPKRRKVARVRKGSSELSPVSGSIVVTMQRPQRCARLRRISPSVTVTQSSSSTGRVVSQYLSGTHTRRIGPLVDQCPEPYVEIHPTLAEQYGLADGDWMTLTSRRGELTLKAKVVKTIRPDTVFIPYHWAGRQSANILTIRAYDPMSKIPEFKKAVVKIAKAVDPERASS